MWMFKNTDKNQSSFLRILSLHNLRELRIDAYRQAEKHLKSKASKKQMAKHYTPPL